MSDFLLNDYSAAVCITKDEINTQLKKVFDTTDDLPKNWNLDDNPDPDDSEWSLRANLSAPTIDFGSDLVNGVRLHIPLDGTLEIWQNPEHGHGAQVQNKYSLKGITITLDTKMSGIEHVAGKGDTVDANFSVQSLYADMELPSLDVRISGDGTQDIDSKLDSLKPLEVIIKNHVSSPDYISKYKWIIGKSKIPTPSSTTGPLAPTSMRFSRYRNESSHQECLNWNLMTQEAALPDLNTHNTAGNFAEYPINTDQPGILIISNKILFTKIIAGCFSGYGVNNDNFKLVLVNNKPLLQMKDSHDWVLGSSAGKHYFTGKLTTIKCSSDVANNRIKIDYVIEHMVKKPLDEDFTIWESQCSLVDFRNNSDPDGGFESYPPMPKDSKKRRVSWSGYLTLDVKEGGLKATYTQDNPNFQDEEGKSFGDYLEDILSLGLKPLMEAITDPEGVINDEITKSINNLGINGSENMLSTCELPGGATFEYHTGKIADAGYAIDLKYK